MDQHIIQANLSAQYTKWKNTIRFSKEQAEQLSPPLLLHVTEDYCRAEIRVLLLGQETKGWEWNSKKRKCFPLYPHDWPFRDISSMQDFLSNEDSVEALCWSYREFNFAEYQPKSHRSPFWRAFREVQKWPSVGVMWGNVARVDYMDKSILQAPEDIQKALVEQQRSLFAAELRILDPHICIFFTGPNYDDVITDTLLKCKRLPCNDFPERQLAKLVHPLLPAVSIRTYHPSYLSRSKKWDYIEAIRKLL
jgi:hypothetical protein